MRIVRLLQAHKGADKTDFDYGFDGRNIVIRLAVSLWQITENIIISN